MLLQLTYQAEDQITHYKTEIKIGRFWIRDYKTVCNCDVIENLA